MKNTPVNLQNKIWSMSTCDWFTKFQIRLGLYVK